MAQNEFDYYGFFNENESDDLTVVTAISSVASCNDDDDDVSTSSNNDDVLRLRPLQLRPLQQLSVGIRLVDARSNSLTVTWPAVEGAKYYHLEATTLGDDDFRAVLPKLTNNEATIRKLLPKREYHVWVTPILDHKREGRMMMHRTAFSTISKAEQRKCMQAPTTYYVDQAKKNELLVTWKPRSRKQAYDLQFRQVHSSGDWTTIGVFLECTQVKLVDIVPTSTYQFRVKPTSLQVYSPPSRPGVADRVWAALEKFHITTTLVLV